MEVKIIQSNNQKDQDFINNNPLLKKTFENHVNWKRELLTSDQIFEKYNNNIFSLGILPEQGIVSIAMLTEYPDTFYISDTYSSVENIGGCTKVIANLLNFLWDKQKLQFKDNLNVQLGVAKINTYAIKCYTKFGFVEKLNTKLNTNSQSMILTKEAYAEKYLLPLYENKLVAKKTDTDQNIVKKLDQIDEILLEKTKEFMMENCNDVHPLVAAMIHKDGHIVYGLSSTNPLGNDVHGEHTVISQAHIYDKNNENFIGLVCMTKPKDNTKYRIKAPCGVCRELIKQFYPNIYVIVPDNDPTKFIKIISKYLLPYPYVSSRVPNPEKLNFNYNIFNE
jgi:cytidine deaminase